LLKYIYKEPVLLSILFFLVGVHLHFLWPHASFYYVAKNVLPLYAFLMLPRFRISNSAVKCINMALTATTLLFTILTVRRIIVWPNLILFHFENMQALVYAPTAVILIQLLRQKFSNQTAMALAIGLIALASETWELPNHIQNWQKLLSVPGNLYPLTRYIYTTCLRLTLILPIVKFSLHHKFKPNLLFLLGVAMSVFAMSLWLLPEAKPYLKFTRIPNCVAIIGYSQGLNRNLRVQITRADRSIGRTPTGYRD